MNHSITEFIGKVIEKVDGFVGGEEIRFEFTDGSIYRMMHFQDCCEQVRVEDIDTPLEELVGHKILAAEESTQDDGDNIESGTWTFYRIRTERASTCIRWLGESNGYYSESVDIVRDRKPNNTPL